MRTIEERLQEYADSLHSTAATLEGLVQRVEAAHQDDNPGTDGLRELAKIQTCLANDLDTILRGEELKVYAIEVVIPDGQ